MYCCCPPNPCRHERARPMVFSDQTAAISFAFEVQKDVYSRIIRAGGSVRAATNSMQTWGKLKMASTNNSQSSYQRSAIALAVASAVTMQAANAQDDGALEEIVVTATKRAVNIQDVPVAVTSVSSDKLAKMQITDILSLEKAIPGLTIASYGNNAQAIMRGAGTAGSYRPGSSWTIRDRWRDSTSSIVRRSSTTTCSSRFSLRSGRRC